MQEHRKSMNNKLEKFLITGNPGSNLWSDVMLQEGITRDIYRPLQSHQTLKIPADMQTLAHCPAVTSMTKGNLTSTTGGTAFAINISITVPPQPTSDDIALIFCGTKNYRLLLGSNNITTADNNNIKLEALIDKRQYDHSTYQVFLQNGASITTLAEALTIPAVELNDRQTHDCATMKKTSFMKKAFQPIIAHYCQKN